MERSGLPGMAVAVVYRDEVVYSKGFGVREVGKPEEIGPDTVFQVASVSKPLASTVVAGVVGRKVIAWTDPVIEHNKRFALKDDFVTRNATFADLMSHRSGLKTASGDLLEDLGFIVATFGAVAILGWRLGARPTTALLTGVGVSLGLYGLFDRVLGLPLPLGLLEFA